MYSWVVPILPYLDNQELLQPVDDVQLPRRCPTSVAYFDPTNYVAGPGQ